MAWIAAISYSLYLSHKIAFHGLCGLGRCARGQGAARLRV
jgi:peptidoglycan/LPS O-acetylase OafA/YrhL